MLTSDNIFDRLIFPVDKPLICLEVNPPRGVEVRPIIERLSGRLDGVEFLNVTDSALAKMRLAALPFAAMLKDSLGVEPLVNVSCRDRNLIAIQGDLLAAWAAGIRSIVALTGDAVSVGDSPERKSVFEVNSIGLLNVINTLNSGSDVSHHTLRGHPQFVPGVVVNPNARNPQAELKRLLKKQAAGARYALSQPVFDPLTSRAFFEEACKSGMPILMGLLPLKSARAAEAINKIPGIRFPDVLLKSIPPGDDASDFFFDYCLGLAEENRKFVSGFHVVCGASPSLGLDFCRKLVEWRG